MKDKSKQKFKSFLTVLESFFSSWRFPVFMLSVLFFFALLVIVTILIPVSDSVAGTFAKEFKTWCLGYDPATGEIESIYFIIFLVQPTILSLFIWAFWHKPLMGLVQKGGKIAVPYISSALILVISIGLTLPSLYATTDKGELPFPAQDLRTEITAPSFTLTNQDKENISLEEYRGDVIMVTAVYASCAESCPLILEQAKEVLNNLDKNETEQLQLMALTMDPNNDTPGMLKMTADHYELTGSNQHLLTGEAEYINDILDQLNIPRQRREDGAIDHANIFVLIDKKGKIAYRFTLGDRQKKWLLKATRLLIEEPYDIAKRSYTTTGH